MSQGMNIKAYGFPWYRKEDWPEIKRIMTDAEKLHDSYEDWLGAATQSEQRIRQSGQIVVRAYIDPVEFPNWCRARGLNVDAEARALFASTIADEKNRYSN